MLHLLTLGLTTIAQIRNSMVTNDIFAVSTDEKVEIMKCSEYVSPNRV